MQHDPAASGREPAGNRPMFVPSIAVPVAISSTNLSILYSHNKREFVR